MGKLLAKNKEIVVPGEKIAEGMDFLPSDGTYRDKEDIICSKLGMLNVVGKVIKIIPLSGKYMPKKGDTIIGRIFDITFSGWLVDINCAYTAMLNIRDATSSYIVRGADLTKFFNIGDYIVAKIINVTSQKLVDLTTKGVGLKKIQGGIIIKINPTKVPRVIGKKGSMIELIKKTTGCKIIVGQNGLIWLDGEPEKEVIAEKAIRLIEEEAHTEGLTEKVKEFLERITKNQQNIKNK